MNLRKKDVLAEGPQIFLGDPQFRGSQKNLSLRPLRTRAKRARDKKPYELSNKKYLLFISFIYNHIEGV
jgi:hypothetical protein